MHVMVLVRVLGLADANTDLVRKGKIAYTITQAA
jgi:hypothetical protein